MSKMDKRENIIMVRIMVYISQNFVVKGFRRSPANP